MAVVEPLLEDLLVVQFARHYGTSDLSAAAQGLARSPFLSKEARQKTPEAMQAHLTRVAAREHLTASSDLDALFLKLRKRKMDALIRGVREQETIAEEMRQAAATEAAAKAQAVSMAEAAEAAAIVEEEKRVSSAKVEAAEEMEQPARPTATEPVARVPEPSAATLPLAEDESELVDELMQDVSDGETESDVRPSREPTAVPTEATPSIVESEKAAPTIAEVPEEEEVQAAEGETKEPVEEKVSPAASLVKHSSDELSELAPEQPQTLEVSTQATQAESLAETLEPEVVSETVPESHAVEEEVAVEAKTEAEEVEMESVPRGRRKRSETMNTVASVESVTPASKRGRRKQTIPSTPAAGNEDMRPLSEPEQASLKRFQGSVLQVLSTISGHKYASLFAQAVSDKDAPNYSKVVHQATDLKLIKAQVKAGQITNTNGFHRAILRMLSNAVMYNQEGSEVSKMAKELAEHCEGAIAMYRSAEFEPEQEETRTPKRRRKA